MIKKAFGYCKEIIIIFVLALALSLFIKNFLLDNRVIPTSSMAPTVPAASRILVNQLAYDFSEPEFGDIVIFEPTESTKLEVGRPDDMLKRVIGLAGDEVLITGGRLYVNGQLIEEPYLMAEMQYEFGPVTVPEDCVFVLGDNRNSSFDSHLWSDPFVPVDNVRGKAFILYWPLEDLTFLN